jgi:aminopeptidase
LIFVAPSTFGTTKTCYSTAAGDKQVDGVVVGIFEGGELTPAGQAIDKSTSGALTRRIKLSKKAAKGEVGSGEVFLDLGEDYPRVAVVGLGKHPRDVKLTSEQEDYREGQPKPSDAVRQGAARGARLLRDAGSKVIGVESFGEFTDLPSVQLAAEGALLGLHKFDELFSKKDDEPVDVQPWGVEADKQEEWNRGKIIATAQNFARVLTDTPANLMTPTIFSQKVEEKFASLPNKADVKIFAHDKAWAEEQGMGCFLGVTRGSEEPPKFLEIHYNPLGDEAQDVAPIIFVGKGVTFDSGGISIKPSEGMGMMRGDMGGAAAVVSTVWALASLQIKTKAICLTPLCENMPSGTATKPGDVLRAKNGKTVEVDNTDAEGRLILADALVYANSFKPAAVIDVATLTGAMVVALGAGATGVFTTSDKLWREMDEAGWKTDSRVWRMPLFSSYKRQIKSAYADLKNVGGRPAGSSTAALFLKEFVETPAWMHMDIAGVMHSDDRNAYTPKGMAGEPVRTLVQWVRDKVEKH